MMLWFVTAQWRRRPARVLGALLAGLVATPSFTPLTGSTETGRLRTVGLVRRRGGGTCRSPVAGPVPR